ncbi:LLM class flavin-dependent oxidoreductase [Mycolicibacterium goodii]|uniref:Luciferase-like domain-containing protein n=1 Tax=Mycolicibacterium goodii TaxID=134601 RepID=A0A0K0XER5_MYCGD|nr:hypothetical protein AFA91_32745 [Mycolicibacterium goodii]
MGELAEEHGFDFAGVADSPGQCLDCWVAASLLSAAAPSIPIAVSVTNFVTRHWTTTASAAASLATIHDAGFRLGVGAGHSAVRNFGLAGSSVIELEQQLDATMRLVRGEEVSTGPGSAQLTWTDRRPEVYLAASHQKSLNLAGRLADGVFVSYGLTDEAIAHSTSEVARGARGRSEPGSPQIWQLAALDCVENRHIARATVGQICAFLAGYVVGRRDPAQRGVPAELTDPMRELVARFSTRPSHLDAALVDDLGLFDYLSRRFAIWGEPPECLEQARSAIRAGARSLLLTVGRASNPIESIDLFGRHVLPVLRAEFAA